MGLWYDRVSTRIPVIFAMCWRRQHDWCWCFWGWVLEHVRGRIYIDEWCRREFIETTKFWNAFYDVLYSRESSYSLFGMHAHIKLWTINPNNVLWFSVDKLANVMLLCYPNRMRNCDRSCLCILICMRFIVSYVCIEYAQHLHIRTRNFHLGLI